MKGSAPVGDYGEVTSFLENHDRPIEKMTNQPTDGYGDS